jgi:hypothetical protein
LAFSVHFPQLCLDIKQWAIELGDPDLPRQYPGPCASPTRPGDDKAFENSALFNRGRSQFLEFEPRDALYIYNL